MSNKPLSLDNFTESLAGISKYKDIFFDDDNEYKKMIEVLLKAIDGELTQRQRECVILYYGEQKRLHDISIELGIYPSTVSRHLSKARKRLEKVLGYYFNRLN